MTQREQVMAGVLITFIVLIFIVVFGYLLIYSRYEDLTTQIDGENLKSTTLAKKITKARTEVEQAKRNSPRLAQWQYISLPELPQKTVRNQTSYNAHLEKLAIDYQQYLSDLLRKNKFQGGAAPRKLTRAAIEQTRNIPMYGKDKPVYRSIRFEVEGWIQYPRFVQLLREFRETELLHRISSFRLTRTGTRSDKENQPSDALDVAMTVEVLLVTNAERRDTLKHDYTFTQRLAQIANDQKELAEQAATPGINQDPRLVSEHARAQAALTDDLKRLQKDAKSPQQKAMFPKTLQKMEAVEKTLDQVKKPEQAKTHLSQAAQAVQRLAPPGLPRSYVHGLASLDVRDYDDLSKKYLFSPAPPPQKPRPEVKREPERPRELWEDVLPYIRLTSTYRRGERRWKATLIYFGVKPEDGVYTVGTSPAYEDFIIRDRFGELVMDGFVVDIDPGWSEEADKDVCLYVNGRGLYWMGQNDSMQQVLSGEEVVSDLFAPTKELLGLYAPTPPRRRVTSQGNDGNRSGESPDGEKNDGSDNRSNTGAENRNGGDRNGGDRNGGSRFGGGRFGGGRFGGGNGFGGNRPGGSDPRGGR